MKENIEIKTKYVAPSVGYFEINNGNSVYRLMEKMTDLMGQDKLAELYEIEKEKGNPLPMNSIQHYELFKDAVKAGNSDLLNFLQKGLQRYPNTLTRVVYNPKGEQDETIHNYGTSDAYSIMRDIVGEDTWIKNLEDLTVLEPLLKTKDVKRIDEISNAINRTPMYLWRFNSKPSEKTERVVRFDADDDWLCLYAGGNPSVECPAFLVEKVK